MVQSPSLDVIAPGLIVVLVIPGVVLRGILCGLAWLLAGVFL